MRLFCCGCILAALLHLRRTQANQGYAARPFRGSARSRPGVFTSPVTSTARYRLLPFSTPLHIPRQHHELARVRPSIVVIIFDSEFHFRFKKSMNRAGTTVRMKPLVFPSADNLHTITTPTLLQLLQKTGQIERTVDQDFASEEAKYKVCVALVPDPSRAVSAAWIDSRRNAVSFRRTERHTWTPCAVCLRAFAASGHCASLADPSLHARVQPCLRRSSAWRRRSTPFMVLQTEPRRVPWQQTRTNVPSKNLTPVLAANWSVADSFIHYLLAHSPFLCFFLFSFLRHRTPPIARPSLIRSAR
jgi:hypothetical protein